MKDKIEELRLIDDEIFEVTQEVSPLIPKLLISDKENKTNELFFMYFNSTNFIKNSIFDTSTNEDIYTVKILFRSLLEHYIRFKYIFIKNISSEINFDSKEYFLMLEANEYLDYIKSIKRYKKIEWTADINIDEIWEELLKIKPEIKKYSRKEVEEYTKILSVKNIIHFLDNQINKDSSFGNNFLKNIILEYSELSSYVHWWILAYNNNYKYSKEKERYKELIRLSKLALIVSSSVKLFTFLSFSKINTEFQDSYLKLEKLIKKIN